MAITKVAQFISPPTTLVNGYDAQNAHIMAFTRQIANQQMILTQWLNTTTTPAIALGSYISHGGALYQVDTAAYAVDVPVADGTYYLMVEASGETLLLSWISDISGFSWNAIYNGLYDGSENQVLAYQMVVSGTVNVFLKRKIMNPWNTSGFQTVDYAGNVRADSVTSPSAIIEKATLYGRVWDESEEYTQEIINAQTGSEEVYLDSSEFTTTSTVYVKGLEKESFVSGTMKVSFTLRVINVAALSYGRIYVNGSPVGTERTNGSQTPATFNEDINVEIGDLVQIYAKTSTGNTIGVKDMKFSTLRGFII